VLPFCPFVKAFIERHREFEELVADAYREQFGLSACEALRGERPPRRDERLKA
jgi:hypothetical protein